MRPGLSDWMCWDAEVLELLAFWKPEQQAAWGIRIWRPLYENISYQDFLNIGKIKVRNE